MNGHGNSNIMSDCCGYSRPVTRQQSVPAAQMSPLYGQRQAVLDTTSDTPTTETPLTSITPTTLQSTDFLAGLLTTYIGQRVRVQFLIGTTGPLIDIVGDLQRVGANYITLQLADSDDIIICDMFSIKFVTVLR